MSDETKEKAKVALKLGIACLKRRGKFAPYVAGDSFTYADIMFAYSLNLARGCAKRVLDMDLLEDFASAESLLALIASRDSAKLIAADQKR